MKARKKAKSITCWVLVDEDGDVVYDITSDRLFAFLCTTRKRDLPRIYDCVPVKVRLVFKEKKEKKLDIEGLSRLIFSALRTERVYNKQWYLEQIAGELGIDLTCRNGDWTKGVSPHL
jgi:hypothetical protein